MNNKRIFLSLFFLSLFAALPTDLIVAGLPAIAKTMHSSAYISQLTMTLFLFGFAAGQFVYGPFSDYFGRKKIIFMALGVAIIGSIICSASQSIVFLLIGRLLQGIGASAGLSIPRAILRDIFYGNKMSQFVSYLSACVEMITAVSPFVGGYVVQHFHWRYNFYILLFLNLATLVIISIYLPETNTNIKTDRFQFKTIFNAYKKYFFHIQILFYALCGCIAYSNLMLYFTVSPFLLQNEFHLSPQYYGFFTMLVSSSLVIGAIINSKLVKKLGINKMILLASTLIILSGTLLSMNVFFSHAHFLEIVFSCMICVIGSALLFANAISGALQHIQKDFGIVSALYGGLQMSGSFLIINFITQLNQLSDLSKLAFTFSFLGIILFALSLIAMPS